MNLKFVINKPVDIVFDYLINMNKFASVHPVITRIDHLTENNYLVYETLELLFIPLSFTYKVTVSQNFNDKNVLITATVMKKTKIEMSFILSGNDNTTMVNETIHIQSPYPIKSIMRKIFKKQHTALFRNIELVK